MANMVRSKKNIPQRWVPSLFGEQNGANPQAGPNVMGIDKTICSGNNCSHLNDKLRGSRSGFRLMKISCMKL